jgi:hypothetical protein
MHHLEALGKPRKQIEPARLSTVSLRFVTIALLDFLHGGVVGEVGRTFCQRNHQSYCCGANQLVGSDSG